MIHIPRHSVRSVRRTQSPKSTQVQLKPVSEEQSTELVSQFHARIESVNGESIIQIPESEVTVGPLEPGEIVRVGLSSTASTQSDQSVPSTDLPVSQGEEYELEIESVGDQGDGIARTDEGFVVIVPETRPGERVRAEITDLSNSVAFAEVVERYDPPGR